MKKKKKKKKEEEEKKKKKMISFPPTWEHKAVSGTDSILCAKCKSIQWEAPERGAYQLGEKLVQNN